MFMKLWLWVKDKLTGKPTCTDRGVARSGKWPEVRAKHLQEEPKCQWCGGTASLEVHHIKPFHLNPDDELQDSNLITLCEKSGENCHLKHGHPVIENGQVVEYNFRTGINPNVRQDCIDHQKPIGKDSGK